MHQNNNKINPATDGKMYQKSNAILNNIDLNIEQEQQRSAEPKEELKITTPHSGNSNEELEIRNEYQ